MLMDITFIQELLAPRDMTFYSQDWSRIASRSTMVQEISEITHINHLYLHGNGWYNQASVAQKMSWISRRHTTRIEDMAYCMLGIFGINMPLLYGEGPKSFTRLQEEIIRTSNDQTIFCWTWTDSVPSNWVSLLAPCPQVFEFSEKFASNKIVNKDPKLTYKMTNAGLSIKLPIVQAWDYYLGILNAQDEGCNPAGEYDHLVCLPLQGSLARGRVMHRGSFPPGPVPISVSWALSHSHVYISCNPSPAAEDRAPLISWDKLFGPKRYSFLLLFGNTEKLLDEDTRVRDYNRSELSPGNRVCLLKTRRPLFRAFPPGVFDEERSLITLDRSSLPQGFLIRVGMNHSKRFFFIGIGTRSQELNPRPHELYRVCNVVPESEVRGVSDQELLTKQINFMGEKHGRGEESSRYGITIVMKEEAVTEEDFICLTYICCEESDNKVNSDNGSDTCSDVDLESGRESECEMSDSMSMKFRGIGPRQQANQNS